jgi:aconitate hydratase
MTGSTTARMVPWRQAIVGAASLRYCSIEDALRAAGGDVEALPYSLRVLAENVARHLASTGAEGDAALRALARWPRTDGTALALFVPRVILPDSSGLPVLLDLAAMRDAFVRTGLPATRATPQVPIDLVVDHSLQVDRAGDATAMPANLAREFERNGERYRFLKWAQAAFPGLRVFPPGTGIIHQVNLEHLASVVTVADDGDGAVAFPDFVIGGDSHTPMVGGLGVLGWGVGGIEAEAAMLGQPVSMLIPQVVGVVDAAVFRLDQGIQRTPSRGVIDLVSAVTAVANPIPLLVPVTNAMVISISQTVEAYAFHNTTRLFSHCAGNRRNPQ